MNSKKSTKTSLVVKKSSKNQTLSVKVTSASSGGQNERPTSVVAPAGNSRLNATAPKVTSKTDALQSSNLASNRIIDTKKRTNSAASSNQTGNVVLNSKPHREASSEKSRQTVSRKISARRPVAGVTTSLQTETKHVTSPQLVPRKLTSPQPASKKMISAKHPRNVTQNQNVAINSMSPEPATRQVTSPPSPPSPTSRKTTTLQSESRKNTPPQSMSKRVIPPNISARMSPKPSTRQLTTPKPSTRSLASPKPSTRQLTTPKPSKRSLASSKPSTRQLIPPNPSTRSLASPKPVASKLTPTLHDAKKTAPLTSVTRQQSLTENVKRKLTSSHTTKEQPCSLTTVALELRSPQTVTEAKSFGQTESFSSATLKHASEQGCFKTRALDMKSLARTETNVDQNVIRNKCTTSSKSSSLKNNAKGTKTKTNDTTSVKSKRSSARCVSKPCLKSNLPTICATQRTNAEQMIYSSNSNAFSFSLNGELNNRKSRSTTPSSVTSSASDSVSSSSSSGILKVKRAVSNNRNKMCNKAVNSNSISNIINSKANVLPPAMKTKLSPTAQTVTDRLMNPAKFKISKSENNTDRSTQLMPSTAKGKQIYGFTKQEKCKLKTDKNESTPSSPRHLAGISVGGKTVPLSCDSFIPSENNKLKVVSNVRKTNKIYKDEVVDNTNLVTKCCTDQVFSETWNCLAKHHISTGDKCSDTKNAAIEERNTCIFCQKQNKGSSAFDLRKGGNSSSLSAEVSDASDLGNGLLTTSDALSGSEIICTSESTLVGYPSKDTLNISDGNILEQNIGISKNKAVSKKKGLENNADLCLTDASISPECCSVSEDETSNYHRIYNVSNISLNATNQASMDDAKLPSNNRLCTSNILRVSKSCCNFDDVKHDSKTLSSGILHFKLQSKISDLDGLLSKRISGKVPSFMKRSNSEDNLICYKDFTLASDSEQILNTLSAIHCIRCKCAQDECNCTTEKGVNEICILKSDRDLAGNRHTGIQVTCGRESADKSLLSNTVNSNFENTHCLQTAFGRNSFIAVDVNLLYCTSENKGNKIVDPFCDMIINVEGVHPSTATSNLCNINDKIQTINISQREESKNLQNLDKTILYQVGDVSKHMSRVDPDIITFNTPFSRIQTSESDALSDGKIAENSLCAKQSSDMESINVKTDCVMPVTQCSSLDNRFDMMNDAKLCVEESKHGINCDTKYGIKCDANFIHESESVSDKHLQSNYSVYENMCGKLDNSVVSSETCAKETECELFKCMPFINDDNTISMANTENNETLNTAKWENVLLAAEEMCCELDLPSPQHALVKECLQTHEIQVMNQICDLLQGSKNNQEHVGSGIIDISNLADSYRDDAALIKSHSSEQSHLQQDIVDTRTIAVDKCANASHLQVRRTNSYSSLVCTLEAPIATGKTRSNSAGNIPEIFKGGKLVCQLQHFPASWQEKINAYNAFNFMEQTNINSTCTLSVIPSLKELCITHLQNELSIIDNVTTETSHAKRENELQTFNFVDGPADNTFISANSVPHTLLNSQSFGSDNNFFSMNDKLVISRRSDANDHCSADTDACSAYAERPFVTADDASAYVDNSPSIKQIRNMEPGTYLQLCSDIDSAQNILCNFTDNFYYNKPPTYLITLVAAPMIIFMWDQLQNLLNRY